MSFEKLLGDLEELRKAQGQDDGEGDAVIQENAEGAEGAEGEDAEGEDDGEPMGKSMSVTLPNGDVIDAMDATALIKSLQADIGRIGSERDAEREHLGKSLTLIHDMLKEQGDTITKLGEQVVRMANEGRGRKAVVTVQSGDMAKSETTITEPADLAKCEAAFKAGKLSGFEVSCAEAAVNRGLGIPASIAAKL